MIRVIIIFLVLFFPIVQAKFKFFNDIKLYNVEINTRFLPFSIKNYLNGKYQFHLEKNFLQHSGLFGILATINNSINYNLFYQATAEIGSYIVGKNYSLFDPVYIKDLNGQYPEYENPYSQIKKLKKIQDYLDNIKKPFLLVIHPNKAIFNPQWIPNSFYTRNPKKRYIDIIEPILKKYGIRYVKIGNYLNPNEMNFPRSGAHMGNISKCKSAKVVSDKFNSIYPDLFPTIECQEKDELVEAQGEDLDLPKTMNVFNANKSIDKNRKTVLTVIKKGNKPLKGLFLGTSYSFGLIEFLANSGSFTDTNMIFYTNRIHKKKNILTKNEESVIPFKKSVHKIDYLLKHDVFILESTEARLFELGFGYIDSLINQIKE